MININLLPWRDAIQKRLNRKLISGITLQLILTLLLCVVIYFYASYRVTSAGPNSAVLNRAIAQTTNQINQLSRYNKLLVELRAKKKVLTTLYNDKYQALLVIQAINEALPKTINLDRIVKKEDLNLYGTAATNKQVTEFITQLSQNDIIENPVLREAKTLSKDDTIYIKFQISADLKSHDEEKREQSNAKDKR